MASTNGSGRPSGCISIPVEIIRDSNSGSLPRHNSPFRTIHNDSPYSGFSDSPPWNSPMISNLNSRFQPRQSPSAAYDRVISNSQFNQPLNDRSSYQQFQDPQLRQTQHRMYDSGPPHFSRSNEDLLSSPFDSMRYNTQPQYTSLIPPSFGGTFRPESDFVQPSKYTSPLRRSFDALNGFPDMHQSSPKPRQYPSEQQQQQQQQPQYRSTYQTQHQPQPQPQPQQQPMYGNQTLFNPNIVYTNEYGVPTDQYQPNTFQETGNFSNDRSRSPAPQRGSSPARPSAPAQQQQQQQQQDEPELKMAKDSAGPIPMPPPDSSSTSQSTDQQVPSADASASNITPPPLAPEPVRDPNTIALEKLEQIKQMLTDLDQQVDSFTGSTRNDRAYKIIDEQGLKIMIRCDELVDVSADIKEQRKEMIRNVQRVIGKLESKVPATPVVDKTINHMQPPPSADGSSLNNPPVSNAHEQQNSNKKSSSSPSPPKETLTTSATGQSILT